MAVVSEYEFDKPTKWMGVSYGRGDRISKATILAEKQVGVSRLASLQRNGFMHPVNRPLDKMSKADLVDYGREVGADVGPNMIKADLLEAIEGEL